jgi:uncharacterized membrane protein HdeD (DUF308 family)
MKREEVIITSGWERIGRDFLWQGILAILFGLFLLLWPGITLTVLVLVFGIVAILEGLYSGAMYLRNRSAFGSWGLFYGVISFLAGVIALLWPGVTLLVLTVLIAAWAVANGVFRIVMGIELRKEIRHEGLLIANGAISLLFGLLLLWIALTRPLLGVLTFAAIIGIYALFIGVTLAVLGLSLKSSGKRPS